jgi:hypothetical protein
MTPVGGASSASETASTVEVAARGGIGGVGGTSAPPPSSERERRLARAVEDFGSGARPVEALAKEEPVRTLVEASPGEGEAPPRPTPRLRPRRRLIGLPAMSATSRR